MKPWEWVAILYALNYTYKNEFLCRQFAAAGSKSHQRQLAWNEVMAYLGMLLMLFAIGWAVATVVGAIL